MKKVLVVATIGAFLGFERNDINILKGMGYEVYIACNEEGYEEYLNDFKCERFNVPFARSPFSKENIRAYKELKRIIKENQFDLIHCHTPMGGVLARLCAAKYRKKGNLKVIYTAHGFHFFKGAPLKNWILYYLVEWLLSFKTDVIITINKEDYGRAKRNFHAKKVEYIPGVGVDTETIESIIIDRENKRQSLGIDKKDFVFFAVGELHARKNQQVIIEALQKIDNKNLRCIIAGVGPLKEYYENLIKEYNLEDRVKLLGFRNDVIELCKASDCFIHPSIREGLGIAPLEAMACGLPVIGSDVNGMKDYMADKKSGIVLKNPKDVNEMTRAINEIIEDEKLREDAREYNLKVVKQFDISRTDKIMRGIYEEIGK